MRTATCSLLLTIVTSAAVLDQVESMTWTIVPTMPSLRSFFWSKSVPADNAEEIAWQQAAQTQNNIAQMQGTMKDQVKKMQDNISSQVSDMDRVFDYDSGPGTKRTVSVSKDGVTEEMVSNYESPDGSRRGFAKTSITSFGNNNWK